MGQGDYVYPSPVETDEFTGLVPVDFILESIILEGIEWFRTDTEAPSLVFGHLLSPHLSKYGQDKVDEITNYLKTKEIKVVQHWSLIPTTAPCFSIQLLQGGEDVSRAALSDFAQTVDILNETAVLERKEFGYIPINDNLHIGIHAIETPDLVKYMYYLLIYILSANKSKLEDRGLELTTFTATDLSRMNEFLPENMYSRFVNFSAFSIATFSKGNLPMVKEIAAVHVSPTNSEEVGDDLDLEEGITLADSEG